MAVIVGAVLALAVAILAKVAGLDRDRAFYPTVAMVVASYYTLFAVMGAATHALILEMAVGTVFLAAAVYGFRTSLWIVAAALVAHGAFDVVHGRFINNPGMPGWWPPFCAAYDVAAGAWLAWRLKNRGIRVDRVSVGSQPISTAG